MLLQVFERFTVPFCNFRISFFSSSFFVLLLYCVVHNLVITKQELQLELLLYTRFRLGVTLSTSRINHFCFLCHTLFFCRLLSLLLIDFSQNRLNKFSQLLLATKRCPKGKRRNIKPYKGSWRLYKTVKVESFIVLIIPVCT